MAKKKNIERLEKIAKNLVATEHSQEYVESYLYTMKNENVSVREIMEVVRVEFKNKF